MTRQQSARQKTGLPVLAAATRRGFRFCGPLAASRSAVIVMRCPATGSARRARVVLAQLACFDPPTGQDFGGDTWSMTVDAMTGAVLPGLDRARAWMRANGSAILGLGPDRTAIVAEEASCHFR